MSLIIKKRLNNISGKINITGSKSESNRLLILQALFPNITIHNLSNSDDTLVLKKALKDGNNEIDVHHAGTAMRFLTSYFAAFSKTPVLLTGSQRMQERPIGVLVEALKEMGASITYKKNENFPPIQINPTKTLNNSVSLKANISSQYITSLLLIAPRLQNGLTIRLQTDITSKPYLEMTTSLLKKIGIDVRSEENTINVLPQQTIDDVVLTVESDWSSASYFYSIISMASVGSSIFITFFKEYSLQGDSDLKDIYTSLGVKTTFQNGGILLEKISPPQKNTLRTNFIKTPDIAQTFAVSCLGLGLECHIKGLHTLKIKETDRLVALKNELTKLGASVEIDSNNISVKPSTIQNNIFIDTYNDHRMAMAFAPLAMLKSIGINKPEVVSKSYPNFWEDLKKIGFEIVST